MIDRARLETVTYRVAVTALTYTAGPADAETLLEENLTWCLQPLEGIPGDELARVRASAGAAITDPTAYRDTFRRTLSALTTDSERD